MAIFNAQFLANPESFGKHYPISVIDRALTTVAPSAAKGVGHRGSGYLKVSKGDRVSYCQIADQGGTSNSAVGPSSGGRAAVIAGAIPPGAAPGAWFEVYYLPWSGNQTFRITLKPQAPGSPDPDIFFTSALNGCSVFVEGTPQNPTVYHLNDAGSAPGPAPIGSDATTNTAFWTPLRTNMEGRFTASTSPKSVLNTPPGQAVQGPKAVHAMDYMDVTQHYYAGLVLPSAKSAMKEQALQESVRPGERVESTTYQGNIYQPYGTVFGWKQGGTWRFFFQRRAFIAYQYKKTYSAKSKYLPNQSEMVWVKRHFGFECHEFWPNGQGQAVAKANVPLV